MSFFFFFVRLFGTRVSNSIATDNTELINDWILTSCQPHRVTGSPQDDSPSRGGFIKHHFGLLRCALHSILSKPVLTTQLPPSWLKKPNFSMKGYSLCDPVWDKALIQQNRDSHAQTTIVQSLTDDDRGATAQSSSLMCDDLDFFFFWRGGVQNNRTTRPTVYYFSTVCIACFSSSSLSLFFIFF